jgi:hypothetical protein
VENTTRARAEEQFAAAQKKAKKALSEKEKARQEVAERMARHWALRLEKEAADNLAAGKTEAVKTAKTDKR